MFTASSLTTFGIGLAAVLFIFLFRSAMIRNTSVGELGSGYISLTAPVINGYDPPIFYRIMHDLTTTSSLAIYFIVTSAALFLLTQTPWELPKVKLCQVVVAAIHVVFVFLFLISTFVSVGDMVVRLTGNGNG